MYVDILICKFQLQKILIGEWFKIFGHTFA